MKWVVNKKMVVPTVCVLVAVLAAVVYSHCQIPCGIYDDPARFDEMAEHITTVEKSMKIITESLKEKTPNMNQIVRWVGNKDAHADELSEIVTYYFMAQRVKPVDRAESEAYRKYVKKLTLLHEMLFYSMKAKQTTDLAHVEKLRTLLAEFRAVYFARPDR